MITNRLTVIIAGLCTAIVLAGCNKDQKTSAHGRPLKEWVIQMATTDPDSEPYKQAERAIQEIGTNAFPSLLEWIGQSKPDGDGHDTYTSHLESMAAPVAFTALSTNKDLPIVDLTRLLNNPSPFVSASAAHALGCLGKPGLPSLINALSHTNSDIRKNAADYLIFMGTNARPAIPALEKITNDPVPEVKAAVSIILEVLKRNSATNKTQP